MSQSCNICGCEQNEALMRVRQYVISRCFQCKVLSITPTPDAAVINRLVYDDNSRETRHMKRRGTRGHREEAEARVRLSASLISPQATICDVGCGIGAFIEGMRSAGHANIMGFDMNYNVCRVAHQLYSASAVVARAQALPYAENSFDLVTMWDVLEHVEDPVRVLRMIRTVLKPNGRLLVQVPNAGSLGFSFFGRYWAYLAVPDHIFFFTRESLRNVLKLAGLAPVTFSTRYPCEFRHYQISLTSSLEGLVLRRPNVIRDPDVPCATAQDSPLPRNRRLFRRAAVALWRVGLPLMLIMWYPVHIAARALIERAGRGPLLLCVAAPGALQVEEKESANRPWGESFAVRQK